MTRVLLSLSVLEYRLGMAELVRKVCKENKISSLVHQAEKQKLPPAPKDLPALCLTGLLAPPRIQVLDPYLSLVNDRLEGMVHVGASGLYGVMNVYGILADEQGKQIEGGFALEYYLEQGYWRYFPSASLRSRSPVTVRAIAMDPLGGVGIESESITV